MEFHISRDVRKKYDVNDVLFNYAGNAIFGNLAASRELANRVNEVRGADRAPDKVIHAAALFAMGLIDELSHAMIAQYRTTRDPGVLAEAIRWFSERQNQPEVEKLLRTFTDLFPNTPIYRGEQTVEQWLNAVTAGMPNREAAFEELILVWLANVNPAFKPFHEFFDDQKLREKTVYAQVTPEFGSYFATRPLFSANEGTLLDVLKAPMLASPDSLAGQLAFIREKWADHLGPGVRRILLAIDVLKEEDIAIWMQFHPPSAAARHARGGDGWGAEGFLGNEFVGFGHGRAATAPHRPVVHEYEAFSPDTDWMPRVVLIAKSTYVWLEQLSKKYGRHIERLDQIPDEELAVLADRGLNGLWLIGLWERSAASQTIKRLRGQSDAVASAYSLRDYAIAEDLGGYLSYTNLRDRAARFGIRLASDMVPNHMGIDSKWVIEHPDWFLSRPDSPYPSYSFNGPDVSSDSRVEIKIEDHYYDQTDAAVVFRRRDRATGHTEFVYHGNDGTTFAWNDTAQLDYSKVYVREQVIQTILSVARQFPIIRFDAAMTLAKKHVQRLWFPLPGHGGSIPSRAEFSMTQEEFDALMPHEFWREVVDRVAAEVPGTLLLAEAFWLLEGYFVRTLGMHRVYNSAFMNMLRDEENAKYRSYLKKTIEFDPEILKRYVNFMSNPDERTAIDQFGTGDKYFGACTLMSTLPGLPMFGHGLIEGFTERYGMEFKQARMDEQPDQWLIDRHMREIAPLLKKRYIFAGSSEFTFYDFWNGYGYVDENVFAYSNRFGDERSLVLYNNKYDSTSGTIHYSAGFMDKGSGQMRQRSLADGLALPNSGDVILRFRDSHGLEYLRRACDFHYHGMHFELSGFQCLCFVDWQFLHSSAEYPWDTLCDQLRGAGVHNLDRELTLLRLRPLHQTLREVITSDAIQTLASIASDRRPSGSVRQPSVPEESPDEPTPSGHQTTLDPRLEPLLGLSRAFFARFLDSLPEADRALMRPPASALQPSVEDGEAAGASAFLGSVCSLVSAATLAPSLTEAFSTDHAESRRLLPGRRPGAFAEQAWGPVLAWIVLRSLPWHGDPVALFDQLEMRTALADIFASLGMEGEARWQAAAQVRLLLSHASPGAVRSEAFWAEADVRWLAGVNTSSGITYFNREQFEELLAWLQLPALIRIAQRTSVQARAVTSLESAYAAACEAAHDAGYRLDHYITPAKPGKSAAQACEGTAST